MRLNSFKRLLSHRTTVLAVLGAAAILSTTLISPTTANAEVFTCGTDRGNYFDGYYQQYGTGSAEGASAYIINQYGAVCDTDTTSANFTAAWVMIASGDSNGWVQSGYIRWYNHSSVFFSQICEKRVAPACTGQFDTVFGTGSITYGNKNQYFEQYNTSCGCEQTTVNSTVWDHTTFDPFGSNEWTFPYSPQFSGETAYAQSDIPGNAANPTKYSGLHYQASLDNSWVLYPCDQLTKENHLAGVTRADGESWYDTITSCPQFEIYTDTAGS